MSNLNRSEEIIHLINTKGSISIQELAKATYASPSTIRRDVEKLEQKGLLRRHHGGVKSVLSFHPPQIIRKQRNQTEKNSVARKAATLIEPNSTIFMDASTTVQYMIPYLIGIEGLTVYTNGADTAISLSKIKIRTICVGGELSAESMAYVGQVAINSVRNVFFDAMFFSSAGFNDRVVSDWSEEETAVRRAVMEQSTRKYFLSDHTKRGKCYTNIVCRLIELDEIICD